MIVKPSQLVTVQFNVNPSTGVADADSLPAGNVSHDGVADGSVTVTVTDRGTGKYSAAFTVPASGYDPGEFLALEITATVGGLNWAQSWNFQVDTKRTSDLNDLASGHAVNVTQIEGTDATDALDSRIAAGVADLPTNAELATVLGTADDAVLAAIAAGVTVASGGITAASIATGAIDADALAADAVAEIQSGLATAAKLLSYIQSLARNDVTVDADIGGTYDDATDSLQAIRDRGDAAWVSGSSTALLTGTASAGAAGSITLAGGTATDDIYNYAVVSITSGTGAGQTRVINDYVGSTKVATIAPDWAVTPDNTSVFRVDPFPSVWSAVTRTLTGANAVTFNGPVLTSGNVQIVEGDDYHETEGLNLSWTWTDATASYTSATATFYAERPGGADFSKALYSVTKAGSTVTGLMRLTAAESALLTTGAPWSFQIRVTFSSGRVSTKVRGSTDVIARIGT